MVTNFVNLVLSTLTLLTSIFIVLFLVVFLILKARQDKKRLVFFRRFFHNHGAVIIFLASLVAVLGSLFFSEFARYSVCVLCWYQRIFMYPILLVSSIFLFDKSRALLKVIMSLSFIGAFFALYHYVIQVFPSNVICEVGGVSCAVRPFLTFGYISIPMMALTAFVVIFLTSVFMHNIFLKKKKN